MDISHLNIGIMHSLIGKNDGVSIVIDQTVNAMVEYMEVELGHIFFLAAHSSPRFNAETDEIFWHKNPVHKTILHHYEEPAPDYLNSLIHNKAMYAKDVIAGFIEKNEIDLLIAHNTSHPLNFVTAVGLGYYIDELRAEGLIWPKVLVWWHDSYYERERFAKPNKIIKKYLKYLPGIDIDGIAFINQEQRRLAERFFNEHQKPYRKNFLATRTATIPNTSHISWDWQDRNWKGKEIIYPPQDNYNDTLLRDVGLLSQIQKRDMDFKDTVILLQHTRVVPRKRIELAIDFAFLLEKRFLKDGVKKCIAILVSGHSGDEQVEYKKFLKKYHKDLLLKHPDSNVVLLFGENSILSHRDIIVDKKYYKFAEIPSVIAANGGLGTFFSEVEGYGNNLLEMISYGLPVVINKYEVFKKEIDHLGFKLPAIDNGIITDELVEEAYKIQTDIAYRNQIVKHNLEVLNEKLGHKVIAEKLTPLIKNIFTREL
ncbi:MAG: hypothetical protein K9I94_04365 [Bacteroidales bacterium]|nr:hypothetical protein [Bacteroidales bacterium]